jgi:hypothetical protein
VAEAREARALVFRQVPGLAPMLIAALLARTGATMVGLSMGFVAYEQTTSALTVAIVASSFGLAFAASSLIAGHGSSTWATPIGALLWGAVADLLNIDASLGGAGVIVMFGVGAGLVSVLRRRADEPQAVAAATAR